MADYFYSASESGTIHCRDNYEAGDEVGTELFIEASGYELPLDSRMNWLDSKENNESLALPRSEVRGLRDFLNNWLEGTQGDKPAPEAICSRCRAPKGLHAVGEDCNNNCGGKVIANV